MFQKIIKSGVLSFLVYIITSAIIVKINNYENEDILALTAAGGLAFINLALTVFFIKKNISKNNIEFIKGFFLSTIVRIIILVAIFFTIVLKLPLNHFVFGVAFFILYFLFQIIEIYFLHTNKDLGK